MSLLHDPETTTEAPDARHDDVRRTQHRPLAVVDTHRDEIDTPADEIDLTARHADRRPHLPSTDIRSVHGPVRIEPGGRIPWRGMRIRRVRLSSVAKLSAIFWLLAAAVLLGSAVLVWNVARTFGFITEIEEVVTTSLGLDAFEIDGSALFGIAAAAIALVTVLGWVMTILMAAVYNASCAVFGGLAVETGPLQRRRRVFSLRHRGFVTIRS